MPKSLDVHSLGNYAEDELKKYQELTEDELGVKVLNILYNKEIGTSFCLFNGEFDVLSDEEEAYAYKLLEAEV
jgi:hypothetical protein